MPAPHPYQPLLLKLRNPALICLSYLILSRSEGIPGPLSWGGWLQSIPLISSLSLEHKADIAPALRNPQSYGDIAPDPNNGSMIGAGSGDVPETVGTKRRR